jgi:vacuolar-type H+-ATPase subunit H
MGSVGYNRDLAPRPGSGIPTQSAAMQRGVPNSSDVSTECIDYRRMMADWQLVSDLMGGTKTMRQAGARWLPQEPKEELSAYLVRLNRSTFFNAYKRAVQSLSGRPFLRPVMYAERLDDRIKEFILDADLNGRHMDMFLYDVFEKALADGMRHVLIDKATKPGDEVTAEDELRYGRRPYCVEIDPRNMTYWQYEYRFGYPFLTEVRIRETITVKDGDWGQREITQYRVLRPGSYEIWRKAGETTQGSRSPDKEDWVQVDGGTNGLAYIPLVTIYTGRKGFMLSEPPLIDLAWENVHHWQSRSDQNHILHVARVPVWFGKGLDPITSEGKKVEYEISPNAMIHTQSEHGDIKIIEHSGKAIESGNKDLEDSENRMAVLGTELLNKARGTALKTATEIDVDAQAQYSTLARMVRELEDAAENILEYMGDWEDISLPDDEFVTINKEFGLAGHIELLGELRGARGMHDLSRYTYLQEMKRLGALAPQVNVDDEMERIDAEGPDLGMMVPDIQSGETDFEGAVPPSQAPTPAGPAGSKNTPGGGRPSAAGTRVPPGQRMAEASAGR